jgi:antitoxin MazE
MFRTRVEKCHDGLAVIVPESLAAEAGLHDGDSADLEFADGHLVIRLGGPATLAELLAGITPENIHGEWADGPPAGSGWPAS